MNGAWKSEGARVFWPAPLVRWCLWSPAEQNGCDPGTRGPLAPHLSTPGRWKPFGLGQNSGRQVSMHTVNGHGSARERGSLVLSTACPEPAEGAKVLGRSVRLFGPRDASGPILLAVGAVRRSRQEGYSE